MDEFEAHLAELTRDLAEQRAHLMSALAELGDADLELARRGGWTLARVLEHVLQAEWHYAGLIAILRDRPGLAREGLSAIGVDGIRDGLVQSRAALLQALEGVTEDEFYRLGAVGREEYSVASVLENVAQHDVEHLGQVRAIRASR